MRLSFVSISKEASCSWAMQLKRWVELLFLVGGMGFFCFNQQGGMVSAQQTLSINSSANCLFVNNLNSKVNILKLGAGGEVPNTNVSVRPKLSITNVGYNPTGIVVEDGIIFVATVTQIVIYDSRRFPNPPPRVLIDLQQVEYALGFICLPHSLAIYNGILIISCGLTFSGGNPPLLQFDLDGNFIAGTTMSLYPLNLAGMALRQRADVMNIVEDRLFVIETNTNAIYSINLNFTLCRPCNVSSAQLITQAGSNGFPSHNSDAWTFLTFSPYDSTHIYLLHTYRIVDSFAQVLEYLGEVVTIDLFTGNYSGSVVNSTDLANAFAIVANPFEFSFVVSNQNALSGYMLPVVVPNVPPYLFDYFENRGDVPSGMQWSQCPTLPLATNSSSSDDTTTIVLATVLPVSFVGCCCFCLLSAVVLLLLYRWRHRTQLYDVDTADHVEMGRRGKTRFTYREIDPEELTIGDLLGAGAYGQVYKGEYRGAPVAIKTFDRIKLAEADEETLIEIREEAQMMSRLCNHPNVVGFVGAVTSPRSEGNVLHFSLVTEYCPNGSLYSLLYIKRERLPITVLIKMARDIAAGILHLHKEHVIHRDIAARNVLVGDNYAVYISDFGMARLKDKEDSNTTESTIGPIKVWCFQPRHFAYMEYVFTSGWLLNVSRDENIRKRPMHLLTVYYYGYLGADFQIVINFSFKEMFTVKVPWKGLDAASIIISVVKKNMRLKIPASCDPVVTRIINSVWKQNPEKRMKMKHIVDMLDKYHKTLTGLYDGLAEENEEEESSSFGTEEIDPHFLHGNYSTPDLPVDDLETGRYSTVSGDDSSSVQQKTSKGKETEEESYAVTLPLKPEKSDETKTKQKRPMKQRVSESEAYANALVLGNV